MRPILLATDDPNDVFTFWVHHKQCGVQNRVEVLSDGTDVIRYLKGDSVRCPVPALLVASLNMPKMGGLQLLERLLSEGHRDFASVLLIDAHCRDLKLVEPTEVGAASFLVRPMAKKDFCNIMSAHQTITMDGCQAGHDSNPTNNWLARRAGGGSLLFGRSEPDKSK